MTVLAADLGGTNMRAARVGSRGRIEACEVRPTAGASGPEGFVALLRDVGAGCAYAVVGVPGRVDYTAGRLEHAPNLPAAWVEALSAPALSAALGIPVWLANDADLAAVGEARWGAGRGARDVVYLTLSTGVGAGVLLGGRLVRGRRSVAEAGHHVIDLPAFDAGRPSTFEGLASGTALAARAASLGLAASGAEIVARAREGDRCARTALDAVVHAAAVGVRNLAFLFTPERIVVGGGLGLAGDVVLDPLREGLRAYGPPGLPTPIEVVPAALGDNAALVGAAGWRAATRGR